MSKKVINGEVVIYTDNGVKIYPAEVRRSYKIQGEGLQFKHLQIPKGTRYILMGGGKTYQDEPDNIHAADVMKWNIERAAKYGKTKFFRLLLDLMKLAQFDPLAGVMGVENCFGWDWFKVLKNPRETIDSGINFDLSVAEIDAQLYKKYNFTPAMVEFVERRYAYDDGGESIDG